MIILLLSVLSQFNAMPVHSSSPSLLVAAEKVEKQWEEYSDDDDKYAFTTTTAINAIDDNSTSQGLRDEELEQLQKDVKSYLENLRKPYVNYEVNTVDTYRPPSTTGSQSSWYSRKIFFKVLGVIIFLVSSFGCCKTKWRKDEAEEEVDGSESTAAAAAVQPSPPNQAPEQISNQQRSRYFNLELSFLVSDDDDEDGDDDGGGGGSDQNNNNNNAQVESGDLNHSQCTSPPPPPPADDVLLPTYDEILYLSSEKFSFRSTCCDAKRSLQ